MSAPYSSAATLCAARYEPWDRSGFQAPRPRVPRAVSPAILLASLPSTTSVNPPTATPGSPHAASVTISSVLVADLPPITRKGPNGRHDQSIWSAVACNRRQPPGIASRQDETVAVPRAEPARDRGTDTGTRAGQDDDSTAHETCALVEVSCASSVMVPADGACFSRSYRASVSAFGGYRPGRATPRWISRRAQPSKRSCSGAV